MSYRARTSLLSGIAGLCLSFNLQAAAPVTSMVVFGDSLSDIGNTTHLLKSLRKDESPSYLVKPLKTFVLNKMNEFADSWYVPTAVLNAGIELVTAFFDEELAPMLASIVTKVRSVPVLPGDPYWQSRFSNGRVWNEYLAGMLFIDKEDTRYFNNQAFGGSWAQTYDYQLTTWNLIRHPINSLKALVVGKLIPPSLGLTVQAYLLTHPKLDNKTVYFVFSGGNDYLNALRFEENYDTDLMSDYVDNVIGSIDSSVHKLTRAGARHVVILGLPSVAWSPKFANTSDRDVIDVAIRWHNERLADKVVEWQGDESEVDYTYIDLQTFLARAFDKPQDYGLANTSDACIDVKLPMFAGLAQSPFAGNFVLEYAQVLNYRDSSFAAGEKNFNVCEKPDEYLFWDEVHPGTRAHNLLAWDICKVLNAHGYETDCQKPAFVKAGA
ncbi:lysophospholipase/glycerophospholipid:cholesterol acyltransferase PlaC [Legionella sp. CNM-4043-24]|uniref:lysophospholipase/glycerophospholipid:cholestero l acyltransferase PlaC n=1 Tax=Legionella sp. CNM-4043-24 TaxID=3421646 RepID=UPI00403AC76E